jgi:drug/metabolite transporter (DMT)-like permease
MMGAMSRRALFLFAGLGVLWGIPYLFIKIAVVELSPEFLVLARCLLAAALLLPIALRRRALTPVLRRWKPVLAFTIIEIALPFYALGAAEINLSSSTTGLLLASVPLVAIGVAFVMGRRHRITVLNWLGVAIGMAGVVAIVGFDLGGSNLTSVALVGVAVIGYSLGPAILARYLNDLAGIGVITAALALCVLIYLPVVAVTGGWPAIVPSTTVIVSVIVLAVLCSAVAFLMMFALIAEIGPVRTTAITYVNPAVAVVAGALVLSEPVTIYTGLGFALILIGCWLVTKPERRPAAEKAESSPSLEPERPLEGLPL